MPFYRESFHNGTEGIRGKLRRSEDHFIMDYECKNISVIQAPINYGTASIEN